jgi:phosphatidylglycerol---prolipoprotein diacylglyceryl transferase
MGQWLCVPMILGGVGLLLWSRNKPSGLQTMTALLETQQKAQTGSKGKAGKM